jgi:hypothetical protein
MISSVRTRRVDVRTLEQELVVADLGNGNIPNVELSGLGYQHVVG